MMKLKIMTGVGLAVLEARYAQFAAEHSISRVECRCFSIEDEVLLEITHVLYIFYQEKEEKEEKDDDPHGIA